MRRAAAGALTVALLAAPALAQRETPPAPAALAPRPAAAAPRPAAPAAPPAFVPPGLAGLPGGLWRLPFGRDAEAPAAEALPGLALLAGRLGATPHGRVMLLAQASGPATDPSTARRLALQRGLAVKAALVAGGLAADRVDIRALGRLPEGADAVDIQPPPLRPEPAAR